MLSDRTIQKIDRLYKTQDQYEPNLDIADKLAAKTVVMIVGATCEGKNVLMNAAAKLDDRFGVTGTRTSREPREGDEHRYTYYENTDEGLQEVLSSIDSREMVQYAINPYSRFIYASAIDDYPSEYNLADIFSSAIENFRKLGFKQSVAITVISEPDVWLKRFEERFPYGHPQRQARCDEAIESFTWSLSQTKDHFWVENVDGNPELAAREIIAISLGESDGQPSTKQLATESLKAAWSITI